MQMIVTLKQQIRQGSKKERDWPGRNQKWEDVGRKQYGDQADEELRIEGQAIESNRGMNSSAVEFLVVKVIGKSLTFRTCNQKSLHQRKSRKV